MVWYRKNALREQIEKVLGSRYDLGFALKDTGVRKGRGADSQDGITA